MLLVKLRNLLMICWFTRELDTVGKGTNTYLNCASNINMVLLGCESNIVT